MSLGKRTLQGDIAYSAWATGRCLDAAAALTAEERMRHVGQSHASVMHTLHHIFVSERFWVECLRANVLPPMNTIGGNEGEPDPDPESMRRDWSRVWRELEEWIAPLSDDDLSQGLGCRLSTTDSIEFTRWELVRHFVNHATLHRGQIITMLRALGKVPSNLDMMSYYMARR